MTNWHSPVPDGVRVRPTAHVLPVDQLDCALLFCATGSDGTSFWFTPGGGAEPNESPEAAALRELEEESGPREANLGREIWRRTVRIPFDGELREIRERWFFLRTDRFVLDTAGSDRLEFEPMIGHRWWSIAELRSTTARIVPADLGARLADLLRNGPPSEPLDISAPPVRWAAPIHHTTDRRARLTHGLLADLRPGNPGSLSFL